MENNQDQDLFDLLNRADAALSDKQPPKQKNTFENMDFDDDFGDDPMIYRNFSNGYGEDFEVPEEPDETEDVPMSDPAPKQTQQHRKPSQAQKAVNSYPQIHAYNADFVSAQKDTPSPRDDHRELEETRILYQEKIAEPVNPKKEKPPRRHRLGCGCLTVLLIPVLIIGLIVGAVSLYIAPPKTDLPNGTRKAGTSAILLCGADVGGIRTDTMMILYVNSVTKKAGLLSLPRDTYTRTDYGLDVKLNSAYGRNDCGEEGMAVLLDYVQDIIGYRPDGYLLVELPLLSDLIDLMGGVDFDVPTEISFSDSSMGISAELEPGMQHLNGEQSLAVVRFRYGYENQDLGRVDTQKAFLKACMKQWLKPSNIGKMKDVLNLFSTDSFSSLNTGNYLWFGLQLLRCGVSNLRTDTLPGYATYIGDQSFYVLYPDEVVELINEAYNPYKNEITMDDVHIVTED